MTVVKMLINVVSCVLRVSEIRLNVGDRYFSITWAYSFHNLKQAALVNEEFLEIFGFDIAVVKLLMFVLDDPLN